MCGMVTDRDKALSHPHLDPDTRNPGIPTHGPSASGVYMRDLGLDASCAAFDFDVDTTDPDVFILYLPTIHIMKTCFSRCWYVVCTKRAPSSFAR